MSTKRLTMAFVLTCLVVLGGAQVYAGPPLPAEPSVSLLAAGLQGASGSTVGPDGALYVTEGASGVISRVDPQTGAITPFASGLPQQIIPLGGAIDVAFLDGTAYVLVTLVGSDLGGTDVVGIYRVDGPSSFTVIADIGQFSLDNPPTIPFDYVVPTGLQFALEAFRGGFLVTDGHLNRVLWVTLDGAVSELAAFGNTVPTGLETWGDTVFMAEAGPVPHAPEHGKVVAFDFVSPSAAEVASGAPLLVDVEFGFGRTLYALSQGIFTAGEVPADAADPYTGTLVEVNADGTFTDVVGGLNLPTSLEFIGNTAYVVSLTGEIWKIEGISGAPYGVAR